MTRCRSSHSVAIMNRHRRCTRDSSTLAGTTRLDLREDPMRKLTAARTVGARLGRLAAVLAAISTSLLVTVSGVPAAFARPVPPPGGSYGPAPAGPVPVTTIHVITTGGMAGWQITLIALAAALLAATAAVFADRARAARRGVTVA
jgi:hypothetical protein